eukprot:m.250081 g.250081  ORF g.250081 m.250081 type:complete len:146 (-) comp17172_c3_seq1:465-902(-)
MAMKRLLFLFSFPLLSPSPSLSPLLLPSPPLLSSSSPLSSLSVSSAVHFLISPADCSFTSSLITFVPFSSPLCLSVLRSFFCCLSLSLISIVVVLTFIYFVSPLTINSHHLYLIRCGSLALPHSTNQPSATIEARQYAHAQDRTS